VLGGTFMLSQFYFILQLLEYENCFDIFHVYFFIII
jgi:hypothetical protein